MQLNETWETRREMEKNQERKTDMGGREMERLDSTQLRRASDKVTGCKEKGGEGEM